MSSVALHQENFLCLISFIMCSIQINDGLPKNCCIAADKCFLSDVDILILCCNCLNNRILTVTWFFFLCSNTLESSRGRKIVL
jgi:hypothetical protein